MLHFAKGEAPPVQAFWSLTLLGDDGKMVDNVINRYAVRGDRLKPGPDGSVTVYIQAPPPGGAKDANWLPTPNGNFHAPAPPLLAEAGRHRRHLETARDPARIAKRALAYGFTT